jgi:hypothetical protein
MDTAIEWLELQFEKYTRAGVQVPNEKLFKLTEKAKQKEKEQLKEMYLKGIENYDPTFKRKSQWQPVTKTD